MNKMFIYLVNKVNRLFWNFYYCIILFLILISYNYNIINWVNINWVNNINNYFMIALLALMYLWYINNENIKLIFINYNSLLINELNDKEKDNILLMRIAEILLKKGVKRNNNYNNGYIGRRNYGTSRICFGRNDKCSLQTKNDIKYDIFKGLNQKNIQDLKIAKSLTKQLDIILEHPIFNEQSGQIEIEFIVNSKGECMEKKYIWMESVNITHNSKVVNVNGNLVPTTLIGVDKKGRGQYLVNAIYKYKVDYDDFINQKAFLRDSRIGEDFKLTNRIINEVNTNGQNYYNVNLHNGNVTMGNNNTQWNYYETVNDFYENIK